MRTNLLILLVIIGIGLFLNPAQSFTEESRLSDKIVPQLFMTNYKDVINSEDKCVVMFYSGTFTDTHFVDDFVESLMKNLPKDIKFYKVNLKNFTLSEVKYIARVYIGADMFPTILALKKGRVITKVRTAPKDPNKHVKTFKEAFEDADLMEKVNERK